MLIFFPDPHGHGSFLPTLFLLTIGLRLVVSELPAFVPVTLACSSRCKFSLKTALLTVNVTSSLLLQSYH